MIRTVLSTACCLGALALASTAQAETLRDALAAAYANNPTLTAQRANVRVADENVPLAKAAGLPSVDGTVTYQENVLQGQPLPSGFFSDPDRQIIAQLALDVPLVQFGAVRNSIRAAEQRVMASRFGLRSTEAELFTAVVGAYMDVLRDEAVVRLNQRNLEVLEFTLEETRERKAAGNRGPTDVAQAEARVYLAQSQLANAQSQLVTSRETYIRLVGTPPAALDSPPPLPSMPQSAAAAVNKAYDNNPQLLAATAELRATEFDVESAVGQSRPQLSGIAGLNQFDFLDSLQTGTGPRNNQQGTTAFVGLRLSIPFFQGGRASATIRQAQARQSVAIEQKLEAERLLVADARSAFATWQYAEIVTRAAERGVQSNEVVVEGLRAETRAGFRPLLDRLNAEQELLNAEVTLVTARRDAYVAGFALLAAMGMAEARNLNLDSVVLYDPTIYYDETRNRIFQFGRDPAPQPASIDTRETPTQDAKVAPGDTPPVPDMSE